MSWAEEDSGSQRTLVSVRASKARNLTFWVRIWLRIQANMLLMGTHNTQPWNGEQAHYRYSREKEKWIVTSPVPT